MEPLELDTALEELEIRLERLRALYEQYFLGIEKIEPSVARKDVDRRIYVLRREKIRNTAKRFKFQTIVQRYNTFQQYWQRICREIENGTYKRHMLRAERILGDRELLTIAARKRLGRFARGSDPAPADPSRATAAQAAPAPRDSDAPGPGSEPESTLPEPTAVRASAKPGPQYESLNLDMDFLGDWDPAKSAPKPRPGNTSRTAGAAAPAERRSPAAADRSGPPAAPAQAAGPPARHEPPPPAAPLARPAATAKGPRTAARADSPGLSEARLHELHARLIEAKRQTQDKGNVSLENLAKSLRATEARLREQHKNRRIDFDVVIKDGKAVVKPIVR